MRASEFKLCVVQGINNLIDDFFGTGVMSDRFVNATLKILVKQNTYKLDNILSIFSDENGNIDEGIIIEEYSKVLGENGLVFDLRTFIDSDMIKRMMPNKVLVVKKEDLTNMFTKNYENVF